MRSVPKGSQIEVLFSVVFLSMHGELSVLFFQRHLIIDYALVWLIFIPKHVSTFTEYMKPGKGGNPTSRFFLPIQLGTHTETFLILSMFFTKWYILAFVGLCMCWSHSNFVMNCPRSLDWILNRPHKGSLVDLNFLSIILWLTKDKHYIFHLLLLSPTWFTNWFFIKIKYRAANINFWNICLL